MFHSRWSRHAAKILALLLTWIVCSASRTWADEPKPSAATFKRHRVRFVDDKSVARAADVRVLLEAQDGGLLLEARDGRLWRVTASQLQQHEITDDVFMPLTADELGRQLQSELTELGITSPSDVVTTKHYVICSTAGRKYAEWVGGLFERLHDGFRAFWKTHGLELRESEFPLPAIVLKDQTEFAAFATKHDGPEATAAQGGYFSIPTNRIVMFDLTAAPNSPPAKTLQDIQRKIAASRFNVATVIHEATHQLAFNCGMHTRFADNPMWLTEGMAMFFEVPDLEGRSGWKTIGHVNSLRLKTFRQSLPRRDETSSLERLLQNDDRFQDVKQAEAAYAEAWALTFYLIKNRPDAYATYLKRIAEKPRLVLDAPDKRLQDFRSVFDDDLTDLDRELRRFIARQRTSR